MTTSFVKAPSTDCEGLLVDFVLPDNDSTEVLMGTWI